MVLLASKLNNQRLRRGKDGKEGKREGREEKEWRKKDLQTNYYESRVSYFFFFP